MRTRGFGIQRLISFLIVFVSGLLMLGALSSCSEIMNKLRPDFSGDHQGYKPPPTIGGRWAEHGFLDESPPDGGNADRYASSEGEGRSPASDGYGDPGSGGDGWISPARADQNRQDMARAEENGEQQPVSFSNTPNLAPPVRRLYKNGNRATAEDFIDDNPNEGSLWASDGQTNYFFTKNKVRSVGDIISIKMDNGLIRDIGTQVKESLTEPEREIELALAEERAQARAAAATKSNSGPGQSNSITTSQAAPTRAGSADNSVPITPADVDVTQSLEIKPGDVMMAEIVERYPNGNYKIRGTKRVLYKNGAPRLVNLEGVVKGSDISENGTVSSGKLYEYRLQALR